MPTILLIRHGENEYVKKGRLAGRIPGVHLNDTGLAQAKKLAETLSQAPIKAVYSSPLERTMETAAPIAQAKGLDVIPRPGLLELDIGSWEDKTLKALRRRKLWRVVQNRPSRMRFPEGETFSDAQGRISRELDELTTMHKPRDLIVCVSHSDMIKLAVAYFLGLPLDLFQRLMIAPASISTLMLGDGFSQIINMNTMLGSPFPQPHPKSPPKSRKKKIYPVPRKKG